MTSQDYQMLQNEIESIELDNALQDYHAFIYWFIETAFGWSKDRILNSICDGAHDKGIDAVIIDPIELKVVIIQSKYERAGGQTQINDNEIKLLSTVKNCFDSRSALNAAINKGNQATQRLMNEAFDAIRKKGFSLELILISTHKKAPHHDDLISETLGFTEEGFKVYDYDRIMQFYYDKMRDFTPSLGVYNLPYADADKAIIRTADHKSWVLTVSIEDIRGLYNKYEEKLFRKNVRNFLGKSRTNKKIFETLDLDPKNFWYYNNGITILCDKANIIMEKGYVRLENPQVVNGCQTVMSIAKFNGEIKGEVMIRVIESTDHEFVDLLTLYQNSSNPVRNRDLKSNDPDQVRLKHELRRQGYYYEIKRGEEYETMATKYPALRSEFMGNVINNEIVAKLIAAVRMNPSTALTSGSDKFFGDYYDRIFTTNLPSFACLALSHLYNIVRGTYSGNTQKFFNFEKDWVFKNRALYYVVHFLYRQLSKDEIMEKRFVSFCEKAYGSEYWQFVKEIKTIINKYFEYVYKTWNETEYYNTYLQNPKTLDTIVQKYKTEMDGLDEISEGLFKGIP